MPYARETENPAFIFIVFGVLRAHEVALTPGDPANQ